MKLTILALLFAGLAGCQSGTSVPLTPTQTLTQGYDTYTGAETAITVVENSPTPFTAATALKLNTDLQTTHKLLNAAAGDVLSGASASTISNDLSLLDTAIGVLTGDQTTYANPFPVQATTQPTN